MDILPIRKLYILPFLIKVSGLSVPKPRGTTGATKMKIMAIICYHDECARIHESYGYNIWQVLKKYFHIYLNDGDIRNVYHHLKGLCNFNLLAREETQALGPTNRCLYQMTDKGQSIKQKFKPYLEIIRRNEGFI